MVIAPLVYLVVSQTAGNVTDKDITADKVITPAAAEEAAKEPTETTPPSTETTAAADAPSPAPASPWKFTLGIGVNGAMTRSTNVVGTVDGTSAQIGAIVDGTANYVEGQHNWENVLKLTESFTRTPAIPSFLKSADELRLQSTYIYKLKAVPWIGPYARGLGTTSIFRGYEVRGEDTVIVRNNTDGSTSGPLAKAAGEKYGTTKPFEPTLLRESAGMFANPIALPEFTLKTRLGAAMQHVLTREGYAISDDSATPEIEYRQLQDSTQAGAELGVETLGKLAENLTYTARADFFYPVYESTEGTQNGFGAMTTDIAAKLSVRLSKYFSLDYILSLKRVPLIVDEWQVQNGLLVSCTYTVF